MREETVARVHGEPVNLFRSPRGDLFDVDAAGGTDHQDRPLRRAIDDDADVALGCDLRRRRDQDFVDGQAFDRHAEDGLGVRFGLRRGLRELDAARLAAPAGMHLRLHDDLASEAFGDCPGLGRRGRDFAGRHGDAVPSQNVPRLILVQIHAYSFVIVVPARPWSAARPSSRCAMMERSPPPRTNSAAASTLGRMLPVPKSVPASRGSASASVRRRISSWAVVPYARYTAFTLVRINRTCAPISRPRIAATRSLSTTAWMPSSPSFGSR